METKLIADIAATSAEALSDAVYDAAIGRVTRTDGWTDEDRDIEVRTRETEEAAHRAYAMGLYPVAAAAYRTILMARITEGDEVDTEEVDNAAIDTRTFSDAVQL